MVFKVIDKNDVDDRLFGNEYIICYSTIIQKQHVTCMEDSHILIYFNEVFYVQDWEAAQELGDSIIATIELKQVVNPLDNDSIFAKAIEEAWGIMKEE